MKTQTVSICNNSYLDRLREQYKMTKTDILGLKTQDYKAIRLFCLDTELVSFKEVEKMEYEVNSSFV